MKQKEEKQTERTCTEDTPNPEEEMREPEGTPETEAAVETAAAAETGSESAKPEEESPDENDVLRCQLAAEKDKFLHLAAEYDNFRRRTKAEKEALYQDAKFDAAKALLPVYDNLERAMKQETADEAYKKGVEMTMQGLKKAFADFGVTEIEAEGKPFDPALHNAVMHEENEAFGENTVSEVFQTGFLLGEKVLRFAMVKVAN